MSTTVLFVEILVCGAQAALWILLIIVAVFGPSDVLALWKQHTTEAGFFLVIWAYALGVVFDRLWDLCLKQIDRRIREKHFPNKDVLQAVRKEVFSSESGLPEFVDYIRSRMRIARATFCNTCLSTCAALWVITTETNQLWSKGSAFTLVAGSCLSVLSLYAFVNITGNYYTTLLGLKNQPDAASTTGKSKSEATAIESETAVKKISAD